MKINLIHSPLKALLVKQEIKLLICNELNHEYVTNSRE